MATPKQLPWAILLCRFRDDANEPSSTRIMDLYAQWEREFGSAWLSQNLGSKSAVDGRSIADVYRMFFTTQGLGTFNAVRYWDEMSHGRIDISGTLVFRCMLDLTKAQGAALAQTPGGFAYQTEIFKKAKAALSQQHGVDWHDYFGVAVSFQSPDYGAQGGTFDGGPGVFMDIRFVVNNGIQAWGQEMGHAFGLDHSRQDGVAADYQDMWDVMSTRNAFSAQDPNYGLRGPGLNAWNMRSRDWLDESRIWKGPANQDFSELVEIRPLHRRDLTGYLGAELPAIGQGGPYTVELRVPDQWDAAIPDPAVLVHRFEGPTGQPLGTHSYLMKGTAGQLALGVGDAIEIGPGPYSRVRVVAIDLPTQTATVQVCYSNSTRVPPTVGIRVVDASDCRPAVVAGSYCTLTLTLSNVACLPSYEVLWNVVGASAAPAQAADGRSFKVLAPDPAVQATVSVSIVFEDGTSISDSYQLQSVSIEEANLREFICGSLRERVEPNPWWESDPAKLTTLIRDISIEDLQVVRTTTDRVAQTIGRMIEMHR